MTGSACDMVDEERFELSALGLRIPCSNQLSYSSVPDRRSDDVVDGVGFEPTAIRLRVERSTN